MTNRVRFEIVRGTFTSWDSLFQRAADFATTVGRDRVISISHSSDDTGGVVTIWYWADTDSNVLGLKDEING